MPCLANSPSTCVTWQRPQMPRPPHTESTSTPSARAACRTGVPSGKRPRKPEGVKTMAASSAPAPPSLAPAAARLGFRARGRLLAELLEPAHAGGIMAHHGVGGHDGAQDLVVA